MAATQAGNLTYSQLKGVWLKASEGTRYHSNAWASLMAAIAEAESGGDPLATNPRDNNGTQTSWGLWQISLGNHDEPSPAWADPASNAKLAIGKLDSQGLTAWGTYNSGAYRAFLSDKTAAADITSLGVSRVAQEYAAGAASAQAGCLWDIGSLVPNPSFFGFHPLGSFQGGLCILSRSQARAIVGAGLLAGGIIVAAGGLTLILKTVASPALARVAGIAGIIASPAAGVAAKLGAGP